MADNDISKLGMERPGAVGFAELVEEKAKRDEKKQAALQELQKLYQQVVAEVMQLGAGQDAKLATWLKENLVAEIVIPELRVVYSKDGGLFKGETGHEAARDAIKRALLEIAGLEKNEKGADVDKVKFYIDMPANFELKKHAATIELKAAQTSAAPGASIEVEVAFKHLDEVELTVEPNTAFSIKPALLKEPGKVTLSGGTPGKAKLLAVGKPEAKGELEVECLSPTLSLEPAAKEAFIGQDVAVKVGFENLDKVALSVAPADIVKLSRAALDKPGTVQLRALKSGKATLTVKGGTSEPASVELSVKEPELSLKLEKKQLEPKETAKVEVTFSGVDKVRFKSVPAGILSFRPAELAKPGAIEVTGVKDGKAQLKAEGLAGDRVAKAAAEDVECRSKNSLTLNAIRGAVGPGDWVAYHHSMFYVELHVRGDARQVVLEVDPKTSPLPMICGIWKSEAPGSILAKQMIAGGIGDNHRNHQRCPNAAFHGSLWVKLWGQGASQGKVQLDLPKDIDRFVIGVYPRQTNTYTLSVAGTGNFANLRHQVSLKLNGAHPHPGD